MLCINIEENMGKKKPPQKKRFFKLVPAAGIELATP